MPQRYNTDGLLFRRAEVNQQIYSHYFSHSALFNTVALIILHSNHEQSTQKPHRNTNRLLDKTVRFAPTSHARTFKAIGTEDATKSYTQDDYERFLIDRHRDIFTCSELVARTWNSGEPLSMEEICLCTGIEAFLAPNVARRVQKLMFARNIHITHVLMAQTQARHF